MAQRPSWASSISSNSTELWPLRSSSPRGMSASPPLALLAALLDVTSHELLGVLLQHGVDLVEQVVDVLGDLGVPLGNLRVGLGGDVLDLLVALALAGLRLTAGVSRCHGCPPS